MKLQHLAIIFVIIILPITIVLSVYTDHQIKVVNYQAQYSSYLLNATYDSIKAFQLNTINNKYSTIGNSKIRDIEAAINVFYGSLATNLGSSGYTKEDLQGYTPAILFTLYDGYYIYSNYYDTVAGIYQYGLKPFIYYSCRYVKGSDYDFVVNYTLDNTITIIGKVGTEGYVTKTGHLIYDDGTLTAEREVLTENIITLDNPDTPVSYQYIIYNNQKIYKENSSTDWKKTFFYYDSAYTKTYIQTDSIINELRTYLDANNNFSSDSAIKYYEEAKEFSTWVDSHLGTITAAHAVDSEGNTITDFASDTGTDRIFKITDDNNPLQSNSVFNEHRMNVIRKSIETNLYTSIKTFSEHAVIGYEFGMPRISEEEWEKITNNISVVSFLQGIPIGGRVYNDYCVVSNDANKESVNNDSIYIVTKDASGNIQYHNPGCKTLLEKLNSTNESEKLTIVSAYASVDFRRQSVSLTGSDANAGSQLTGADEDSYAYFYPQQGTSCYDCIVTASDAYSTDDIIKGEIVIRDSEGNITQKINTTNNSGLANIRTWYMRALARTRYDLYLTNGYFGY